MIKFEEESITKLRRALKDRHIYKPHWGEANCSGRYHGCPHCRARGHIRNIRTAREEEIKRHFTFREWVDTGTSIYDQARIKQLLAEIQGEPQKESCIEKANEIWLILERIGDLNAVLDAAGYLAYRGLGRHVCSGAHDVLMKLAVAQYGMGLTMRVTEEEFVDHEEDKK